MFEGLYEGKTAELIDIFFRERGIAITVTQVIGNGQAQFYRVRQRAVKVEDQIGSIEHDGWFIYPSG